MAKAKYTQSKDGYWRAKIWDGSYNPDGTKHRINVFSKKSSADLEKKVKKIQMQIEEGSALKISQSTFYEYSLEWLETYKTVRSTNTKKMYSNIITKYFSPLKGIKFEELRRTHFQILINSAINNPRTCQQISLTFRQIIKAAIADRYLPDRALRDLCGGVELPRYHAGEKRPLNEQEKAAISKAVLNPMDKTFLYLIYGCGLRRGEALAISRLNVDLKCGILRVRHSIEFDGNTPALKSPKSDNGIRDIPMPPFLIAHLKEYIPTLTGDYLIHGRYSKIMTLSGYRRMWERILLALNLAAGGTSDLFVIHGLTAHIFRHNYCTELCYQVPAISTKKIAQLLGDTEKMVLDVYGHLVENKENASEVIAKAINF